MSRMAMLMLCLLVAGCVTGRMAYAEETILMTDETAPTSEAGPAIEAESDGTQDATVEAEATSMRVAYRTHVQTFGWQSFVRDGSTSGTSGKAKRLEGIEIKLENNPYYGGIQYRTHVQTFGWQDYVQDGKMSGTSGQAKRLEAIQIMLTGETINYYDVWYRVHAQSFGWLGWAKNDAPAGTAGYGKRLEAIQIKLLPKGSAAPGSQANAFLSKTGQSPTQDTFWHEVIYCTHVQSYGWQPWVVDGQTSGTQGLGKRLESIRILNQLHNDDYELEYRTHVQSYGWQNWVKEGQESGTVGKGKRLEAIQIRPTARLAKDYDVWYRVHAQRFGWMGWASNGESAGTEGYAYRLEGIQILLLPKGSAAPGGTGGAFRKRGSTTSDYTSVLRKLASQAYDKRVSYVLADVYGDSAKELLCLTRPDAGSGRTWRIYTIRNGSAKLVLEDAHGRYYDQYWKYYRATNSVTMYGGGRGYETYRHFTVRDGVYREVASCGRMSTTFGNATNTAWSYVVGSKTVSRSTYDSFVSSLHSGSVVTVAGSGKGGWLTYP